MAGKTANAQENFQKNTVTPKRGGAIFSASWQERRAWIRSILPG
jgi:hypothetical protein